MARRKLPNYRGALGRRFDPWREDPSTSLEDKLCQLLLLLGVDPGRPDAYSRGFHALMARHGRVPRLRETDARNWKHALLVAARDLVPGFQLNTRDFKLRSLYAARHPSTRPLDLELDRPRIVALVNAQHPSTWPLDLELDCPRIVARVIIVALVNEVNALTTASGNKRRSGVMRAINRLTETNMPFEACRGDRQKLEYLYYRHRDQVSPPPKLSLCGRLPDASCFEGDPYFDEVPELCQMKNACPFLKAWETFADHTATEFHAELSALRRGEMYRRLTSRVRP